MKKILKKIGMVYLVWLVLFSIAAIPNWVQKISTFKLNNGGSVLSQLDAENFVFYGVALSHTYSFASVSLKKGNEDLSLYYFWGVKAGERARQAYRGHKKAYPPKDYPEAVRLLKSNRNWAIFAGTLERLSFKKETQQFFEKQFNPRKKIRKPSLEYDFYKNYTFNYVFNILGKADYAPVILIQGVIFLLNFPLFIFLYISSFFLAYLPPNSLLVYGAIILTIALYAALILVLFKRLKK